VISPIAVPPHDGSVFTIAWILSPATTNMAPGAVEHFNGIVGARALGAAILMLVAIAGLVAYRRRTR
jgi:hypothetical protein